MKIFCNKIIPFHSLIYFAEKEGGRGKSWTFMESFWFGLMALTSVGNGEKKPNTAIGKVTIPSIQGDSHCIIIINQL